MDQRDVQLLERAGVRRLAFNEYLRSGLAKAALLEVDTADPDLEVKFNPNHDPATGRFSSAGGGSEAAHPASSKQGPTPKEKPRPDRYYTGMTAKGMGRITSTSGGYVDASGHYIPELFPPDPYRLTDPAGALAHYTRGSGEPRNFYLNSVDTTGLKALDFPAVNEIINKGQPGTYRFDGTPDGTFDSGSPLKSRKLFAASTVGRLELQATGSLVISRSGRYAFNGLIGVQQEYFRFPASDKRTWWAEASTTIGRSFPGKEFRVHVIGTKAFSIAGSVPGRRAKR